MHNSTHSLGQQLVQEVQKQAAMKRPLPMTAHAGSTAPSGASVEAEVVLTDNDRFSHIAEKLQVKVSGQKSKAKNAQAVAEKFCERVSYLPERLQYVEIDARGNAIARSTPSTMRSKHSEYFEAKASGGEISLQRFKPNTQKPGRQSVPFHVTDETLERLADDAAGVLASPAARQ
jgi:hypothetical protein